MAKKQPAGKRLQLRVSEEMGLQVEELAQRLGLSESAVGAVLISAGLKALDDKLSDPVLPAAVDLVEAVKSEKSKRAGRPARDVEPTEQLGFGRGGKPRSDLVELPIEQVGGFFDDYFSGGRTM